MYTYCVCILHIHTHTHAYIYMCVLHFARAVCGGRLSGETGTVRFPRQAGSNYPHGVSCAWTITTTASKVRYSSLSLTAVSRAGVRP